MAATASTSGVPSRTQFQDDVLVTLLALLNQARFAFVRRSNNDETLWSLVSPKQLETSAAFANPDHGPGELGLTFEDIADIDFVQTLLQLHDYGVLGLEDVSAPTLDDSEGSAIWASRTLYDLSRSAFLVEWSSYAGGAPAKAVERCLLVAEIANARLVLEGGQEGCFLEDCQPGNITFRQLALLSSMTEPSLRTLASRGAGLQTVKGERNATYIETGHAKEWLKAKGRYTPLRRVSDLGATPLTQQRFISISELQEAIHQRAEYLSVEIGADAVAQRLAGTGVDWITERLPDGETLTSVSEQQLLDREVMKRLGTALELPDEIFALRTAETVLSERLKGVEQELKGAKA